MVVGHSTTASAQAAYSLWTGQTGAQTQIDVNHTSSWYITVNSGTVLFGGGQFTIKRGSATTNSITLKLYAGSAAGSLLASKTVLPSGVGSSYANVDFSFATPLSLGPGTYFANVTSSAIDTASQQYFIKGGAGALISLDGVTPISSSVASTSATPSASNFILSKSATGTVNVGGPITYTLGLGNDGGSPSGTTATVSDQLPAGVTATVATANTGVGSVTCSNLGVTSALVTCTVNLSAAINSGAPTGTASFTLAATAPSIGGTAVNYASVDAAGGSSPATPGAACTAMSCASATSTVTAPSLDITKTSSAATLTRGGTATFTLTVRNSGNGPTTGATVTVTDTFPAGLTPTAASGTGWSCSIAGQSVTCTRSDVLVVSGTYPTISVTSSVANAAAASLTNTASVIGGGDTTSASGSVTVNTAAPPDLVITKTSSASTLIRGGTGTFTLTVTNNGGLATDGTTVTVSDTLPTGLTPTAVSGTGWTCSTSSQTVTCTRTSALAVSSSYPAVSITASVAADAAASLTNTASVIGGGDGSSASGSVTVATAAPGTPSLTLSKTSSASTLMRGSTGTFTLTGTNSGDAATDGTTVTVSDALPTGLTPTAASGTGWTCSIVGQTVTCTRSDALAAATNYPAISITASVANDAAASLTNTASIVGGGDATTASGSVTVNTVAPVDLTITKTSSAATLTRGSTGTFTLTVTNSGGTATDGTTVTVSDTLPTGLTPTAATGTGWTCTRTGQAVSCTRADVLAATASYAAISITATVAADAAASLTNTANVSGGGDATTASGSVTVNTVAPVDLTITKTSSAATLTRGSTGTFTLTVTNSGGTATDGTTVTVSDTLPTGLTPTAATGTGWTCTRTGQAVSCTRADVLAATASYAAISITATVAADAAASLTNTANVSGGGDATTASGSVTVNTASAGTPSITLTKTSSAATLIRGGTGTFTLTATNSGDAATNGTTVTVNDTLPPGLTPTAASGTGWTCTRTGQAVSCTRADVLAAGASYAAISITATVAADAATSLTNTGSVVGGGDTTDATGAVTVSTATTGTPSLTLTKTASAASLTPGGTGTFTLTVSNSGTVATDGTAVTVSDPLPLGLTLTGMSGTGWTCTSTGSSVSCARSDVLTAGATYPLITVIASVAVDAPASVTNTASVSGGGDASPDTSSVTVSTTPARRPTLSITKKASAATLTRGQDASFELVVGNSGDAATDTSAVTVTDQMPDGLRPTAAGGTGWNCSIADPVVSCVRMDALDAGATYPPILLSAAVTATAGSSITNTATVLGGGDATPHTSAISIVVIAAPAITAVFRQPEDFIRGAIEAVVSLEIANQGGTASGTIEVLSDMPEGLSLVRAEAPGWACSSTAARAECSRQGALAANQQLEAIALTVAVSRTAPERPIISARIAGSLLAPRIDVSAVLRVVDMTPPDLAVTKIVDKPRLRVSDRARFTVGTSNESTFALTGVVLRDTLPGGFAFVPGSAVLRTTVPAVGALPSTAAMRAAARTHALAGATTDATRAIEGTLLDGELVFNVGALPRAARVEVSYDTIVTPAAKPGRANTQVFASAQTPVGERMRTVPVDVDVVVIDDPFTNAQVLLGRVFLDQNGNSRLDRGEAGAPNVRVVTATGLSAVTDAQGHYSFPALSAGSVAVGIDSDTMPDGWGMPTGGRTFDGDLRLLRTPLGGGGLLVQDFGLLATTIPRRSNAAPSPPVTSAELATDVKASSVEFLQGRRTMAAGGMDVVLLRMHLTRPAATAPPLDAERAETRISVRTTLGSLGQADHANGPSCSGRAATEQQPASMQEVSVRAVEGEAAVCLYASVLPGDAVVDAAADPDGRASARVVVRVESAAHQPFVLSVGELGVGLGAPKPSADGAARRVDGRMDLFFQGSSVDHDLLTVAVRSSQTINAATGQSGLFELDPRAHIYPIVGDASARTALAQSNSRLYARYDRRRSFVMYGDLEASTRPRPSGLLDFRRNVTGVRGHVEDAGARRTLEIQASSTGTTYAREYITSVAGQSFVLAHAAVVPGTETIILEVHDRRNPALIETRHTFIRNVDYLLDPQTGVVQLLRRLPLFDDLFNLARLVVTYRYSAGAGDAISYQAEGSVRVASLGLQLGASALVADSPGGRFRVGGATVYQSLGGGGVLSAELPFSRGQLPAELNRDDDARYDGSAIRASVERTFGRRITLHALHTRADRGFLNPYGETTAPGHQLANADLGLQLSDGTKLALRAGYETSRGEHTLAERSAVGAHIEQRVWNQAFATVGIDARHTTDPARGIDVSSDLATAGFRWTPLPRFSQRVQYERNLRGADPTYPNQTTIGAQYDVAPGARLFVSHRWSDAPIVPLGGAQVAGLITPTSTRETAIGATSNLGPYTGITSRYLLGSTINGTDAFAALGVVTRIPLSHGLSADLGIDAGKPVAGQRQAYVGAGAGGIYQRAERLQVSFQYQGRWGDAEQRTVALSGVARVTGGISVLANMRSTDVTSAGTARRRTDGRAAVALRPWQSDRVAVLFAAEQRPSGLVTVRPEAVTRQLYADGYWRITPRLEGYGRVALVDARTSAAARPVDVFLQGRLQRDVTTRFNLAGEFRYWDASGPNRRVGAVEVGAWLVPRTLRAGFGYSTDGLANPGSLLRSTSARGGPYLVFSASLASAFDLMGALRDDPAGRASPPR